MRETLILQQQDDAPAGLIADALDQAGVPWRVVAMDRGQPLPDPASVSLAIPLGSDRSADALEPGWIAREIAWLRRADRVGTPVFGVCFGAQALAVALGGGVRRAARPERGFVWVQSAAPDLLPAGPWLTWHDDAITLPPGAEILASNDSGVQAFRLRTHLGVQFHPEATVEIVTAWVAASREANAALMLDGHLPDYHRAAENAAGLFRNVVNAAYPAQKS